MHLIRNLVFSFLATMLPVLGGCVAVWGGSHKVIHESADSTIIRFDPVLIDLVEISDIASKSCRKFGMTTSEDLARQDPNPLPGIKQYTFSCVELISEVKWAAAGGSKHDATVSVAYQVRTGAIVKEDPDQAKQVAVSRCKMWGYNDADAFDFENVRIDAGIKTVTLEFQCN